MIGELLCALCLVATSLTIMQEMPQTYLLIWINAYGLCYNSFVVSTLFIWTTEIQTDIALGMGIMAVTLTLFFISFFIFPLLHWLGPAGFFAFLAVECMLSFIYVYCYVGETKGLTENEKRE